MPVWVPVAREVQSYALSQFPHAESAMVVAGAFDSAVVDDDRKSWGIIEID